jgi:SdpI/YfhL protein family
MHIPWIEFAASFILIAVSVPLVLRKVPKNLWYGVRTARTINGTNKEWYEANSIVGRAMIITGTLSAAVDLAFGFAPLQPSTRYLFAAAALLVAVVAPLVAYRKQLF